MEDRILKKLDEIEACVPARRWAAMQRDPETAWAGCSYDWARWLVLRAPGRVIDRRRAASSCLAVARKFEAAGLMPDDGRRIVAMVDAHLAGELQDIAALAHAAAVLDDCWEKSWRRAYRVAYLAAHCICSPLSDDRDALTCVVTALDHVCCELGAYIASALLREFFPYEKVAAAFGLADEPAAPA